ncbi:MAG: hypothetical protein ACRD0O_21615 [Acidimicrobiia bacterium]
MLLDITMPGMPGDEAIPLINEASPDTRVVLYSGDAPPVPPRGAVAVMDKIVPPHVLINTLLAAAGAIEGDASGS